jgi:hypothetical protein
VITAFFINIGVSVTTWFFGLFGKGWDEPDWLKNLPGLWNGFIDSASGMSVWIPWTVLLAVLAVNSAAWVSMFVVKIVMKGAAFLPFVGGSG